MKVSEHMSAAARFGKKSKRHRISYRAARRNIAKIEYRRAKRVRR